MKNVLLSKPGVARGLCALLLLSLLSACGGGGDDDEPEQVVGNYTAFSNPETVAVLGYSGDVSEPFISRDGAYLFFNNSGRKNIFFARFVDARTFQYAGALSSINTSAVEGAPSMDAANKFYYVSTSRYNNPPGTLDTLFTGNWNGTAVSGRASVTGLASPIAGFVDFDVEVSPDGSTLYFSEGDFRGGNSVPITGDILVGVNGGASGFSTLSNSASIMANVNTSKLEYAPAISANGLELFFTRFDVVRQQSRIYRTERSSVGAAFGVPDLVTAITGFVEGPALSPDEKSLYYHQRSETNGALQLFRVTRP